MVALQVTLQPVTLSTAVTVMVAVDPAAPVANKIVLEAGGPLIISKVESAEVSVALVTTVLVPGVRTIESSLIGNTEKLDEGSGHFGADTLDVTTAVSVAVHSPVVAVTV